MTYYEILGVASDASQAEIRSNYRSLVKQYHPDLNNTDEAKELIVLITEAYEILSDPIKKGAYDWHLLGLIAPEVKQEPDDRELRKREYIRKKRVQEQRDWEQMFLMKVKFYKFQRYFAYLFLLVSLVYSYDYFITEIRGEYPIHKIGLTKWGDCVARIGEFSIKTDPKFYNDVRSSRAEKVSLHYSSLFNAPVGVGIQDVGYYQLRETVHSFHNFFSYLLFVLGLVLIYNRHYSDWSLTLGFVPFFITFFLLMLTYISVSGQTV